MIKNISIIVLSIFLIILGIRYFYYPRTTKSIEKVSVVLTPAIQKTVTPTYKTIGTVQAFSTIEVKSMVTGPLISAGFTEGDIVQKGQVLFNIDQRPYIAALEQAKANLVREKAVLSNYQMQVKRNQPLVKKGYLNKQDFDTLLSNTKSAEAAVLANEAAVRNAQVNLDYTTIRAPTTGKTGPIALKVGSVIKANDTLTLVTINQINPIYVVFSLPQDKLPIIQENLKTGDVEVIAYVNKDIIERGKLTFIDNTINTATGTVQLRGTFENKNGKLWPGQRVTIEISLEKITNAILVPSSAVLTAQKGFYVFIVGKKNIAHLKYITPGPVIGNMTIIEEGLTVGENVVTVGQLRVRDGEEVEVTKTN